MPPPATPAPVPPLLVERHGRRRPADAAIPIAGVFLVAFLAMQVGMHGHAGGVVARLRAFMRLVPVALGVPPQRLQREVEAVGRTGESRRLAELLRIHCTAWLQWASC